VGQYRSSALSQFCPASAAQRSSPWIGLETRCKAGGGTSRRDDGKQLSGIAVTIVNHCRWDGVGHRLPSLLLKR
jgi:hypothetical protein